MKPVPDNLTNKLRDVMYFAGLHVSCRGEYFVASPPNHSPTPHIMVCSTFLNRDQRKFSLLTLDVGMLAFYDFADKVWYVSGWREDQPAKHVSDMLYDDMRHIATNAPCHVIRAQESRYWWVFLDGGMGAVAAKRLGV